MSMKTDEEIVYYLRKIASALEKMSENHKKGD